MTALREVCFDTETTGFDPATGDRILEIGCVELMDLMPTGRTLHLHIDPERSVPEAAVKVHGLTRDKLLSLGARRFSAVASEILEFFGDSQLVAHNAPFDIKFLNAELARLRRPPIANPVADTLKIAKQKFGTANASLDALCKRFGISLDARTYHGALIDTQLLAQVYLGLNGGAHRSLDFASDEDAPEADGVTGAVNMAVFRPSRGIGGPSGAEIARHAAFLAAWPQKSSPPLWLARAEAAPEQPVDPAPAGPRP